MTPSTSKTAATDQPNCQSCFGLTYFHRSYLDEKRHGRCFGLRRPIPISSQTVNELESQSSQNVSNELDEVWCLGVSRWPTSSKSPTSAIPRCGPGLRLLFLRQRPSTNPIYSSSLPDKQIRMVSRRDPGQTTEKSAFASALQHVEQHLGKHYDFIRKMTAKSIWIMTDTAFLKSFMDQLSLLPNKMEKSTQTYLKYVCECFSGN